jgi:hypothetical protein
VTRVAEILRPIMRRLDAYGWRSGAPIVRSVARTPPEPVAIYIALGPGDMPRYVGSCDRHISTRSTVRNRIAEHLLQDPMRRDWWRRIAVVPIHDDIPHRTLLTLEGLIGRELQRQHGLPDQQRLPRYSAEYDQSRHKQ